MDVRARYMCRDMHSVVCRDMWHGQVMGVNETEVGIDVHMTL